MSGIPLGTEIVWNGRRAWPGLGHGSYYELYIVLGTMEAIISKSPLKS